MIPSIIHHCSPASGKHHQLSKIYLSIQCRITHEEATLQCSVRLTVGEMPVNCVQQGETHRVVFQHISHLWITMESFLEFGVSSLHFLPVPHSHLGQPFCPLPTNEVLEILQVGTLRVVVPQIQQGLDMRIDGIHFFEIYIELIYPFFSPGSLASRTHQLIYFKMHKGRLLLFENPNQQQQLKYDEYDIWTVPNSTVRQQTVQSQPLNSERFTETSEPNRSLPKLTQFAFNEKELSLLKKRFDKISVKGQMDNKQFRESLGILDVQHASFLSERIFKLIDRRNCGKVNFEDFVSYLNTIINGNQQQKARMSFSFLDSEKKGVILYSDFEKMISNVAIFWGYLTGSRVVPDKTYVDKIIRCFDSSEITFEKYYAKYEVLNDILDWFEFFNPGKLLSNIKRGTLRSNQVRPTNTASAPYHRYRHLNGQYAQPAVGLGAGLCDPFERQKEIHFVNSQDCKQQRRSFQQESFIQMSRIGQISTEMSMDGPLCISLPHQAKQGDKDPAEDTYEFNQIVASHQLAMSNVSRHDNYLSYEDFSKEVSNNYLDLMDEKLSTLLRFMETDPVENSRSSIRMTKIPMSSLAVEHKPNMSEQTPTFRRTTLANIPPKTQKLKKNISIYFGHQNWNLILNMMIGMRTAVKALQPRDLYVQLKETEFTTKHYHDVITQRSNNFDFRKAFKFIDYSPNVFEHIRNKFGISQTSYLRSIGPENMLGNLIMGKLSSLTELSSSGKSGSFFYFTEDNKYMIKTISKNEKSLLRRILSNYFKHLVDFQNTMISRFDNNKYLYRIFGLHQMRIYQSKTQVKKVYLTVIANIFTSPLEIDVRYDIKGSMYGRRTRTQKHQKVDKNVALKDQDLLEDQFKIKFNDKEKDLLIQQILSDAHFFDTNGIIDYSLLIGVHKLETISRKKSAYSLKNAFDAPNKNIFFEKDLGGILSRDESCLYFIGIIDILTEYNAKKKLEYQVKSTFVDSTISCVPPAQYARRFKDFILKEVID